MLLSKTPYDMFLVYIPVLSVGLYYCATSCLPASVRRVISRVVSEVVVAIAFTVARTARYVAARRSAYIWDKRMRLPRPIVKVLDTLLRVDTELARMDTSSGNASVRVLTAILTVNRRSEYDVTGILQAMWALSDGVRMEVPINVVLEYIGLRDLDHDSTVVTRVRYRGHSNADKKLSSETFCAKYSCKLSQVFRFPPFASSEQVRRGLGVPRIIRANFAEENGRMLYGLEAKESSGLRRDYYANVDDDPCLEKNAVIFLDTNHRFQEQKQIAVTTSKSNSKILCNQSQIPT